MKIPIRSEQEKEMILQKLQEYMEEQKQEQILRQAQKEAEEATEVQEDTGEEIKPEIDDTDIAEKDMSEETVKPEEKQLAEDPRPGYPWLREEKGIYFLKFQNGKAYHVWKLEVKKNKKELMELVVSQEYTFSRVKSILRDGYFAMVMIFASMAAFYMAIHKNLPGMAGFSAAGMIMLWVLLFSASLNKILPGKECRNFLYKRILNLQN